LLRDGACLDAFGVGTALSTSADAPYLGMIYKLVEIAEGGEVRNTAKFSEAKRTYPGQKQVFRQRNSKGEYAGDTIALTEETIAGAEPLLVPVMRNGRRCAAVGSLEGAQRRFLSHREHLPASVASLSTPDAAYAVRKSAALESLAEEVRLSLVQAG